jgi:arylsulfatase A-like enzyme
MRALVIVVRALHLGYVGCYGNEWIETPALDRLAAEGVLFDQHYADSPDAAGAECAWWRGHYAFPLTADEAPIAQRGPDLLALLQHAGIVTTRVGNGGPPERALEAVRQAVQCLAPAGSCLLWLDLASLMPPWNPPEPFRSQYFGGAADDADLTDSETTEADEPLVPWTGLLPPALHPDDDRTYVRLQRTYAGTVTYLDSVLARLLDGLRRRQLLDGLLLILTADHGLPLTEYGTAVGHHLRLHDEVIHVPLIMRLPGAAQAGRRISALTQPVDLMPTLLEAFGVPLPPVHGHSLFPILKGEAPEVRPYAAAGVRVGEAVEWTLRTPDWAFLLPVSTAAGAPPGGPQLYVKPDDRWEVNNVVQHHLELSERLEQTLRGFVEATRRPGRLQLPPLPDVGTEPAAASNSPPSEGTQS